ncbi:protein kinase [Thermodesulfobacteriota bacterium]
MGGGEERRRWPRIAVEEPELAMIYGSYDPGNQLLPCEDVACFFVGVHNISNGGILVESDWRFTVDNRIEFMLHEFRKMHWQRYHARVAWVKPATYGTRQLAGIEILDPGPGKKEKGVTTETINSLLADIDFLLHTSLLEYIPTSAVWPLLNCLQPIQIKTGETIIAQGDIGDFMFVIQSGTCVVKVRKNGDQHPVARLDSGDVVGEMAALTGEPRCADVIAESEMKLWRLSRKQLGMIAAEYSDIRIFLTELVTNRLENSPVVADRIIGKYLVKSKLDQGGWGIVYHGLHQLLKKSVAIKMLKHQMAMEPMFRKQFMTEAKIIAKMNHKNIVPVFDIEEQYQTIFIIMEYLEGESLEKLLARMGKLAFPQIVDILMQVVAGLEYAHGKGIVHHDIKPGNVFMQEDGQVKILDFGLAFSTSQGAGPLKGSFEYIAPEQIKQDDIDQRVDIYTLGLTAYELVTGKKPHADKTLGEFIKKRKTEEIPDPAAEVPDIPEPLRQFILTACRREPDERFQTSPEARQMLEPLYEKLVLGEKKHEKRLRRMSTINMIYDENLHGEVNVLMEELSKKAIQLGIDYRINEYKDI